MMKYWREFLWLTLLHPDSLPTPRRQSSTPACLHQYSGSTRRHPNTTTDEYNTPQTRWHGQYLSPPSRYRQRYTVNHESQTPPPIQSGVPYVHANETLLNPCPFYRRESLQRPPHRNASLASKNAQ